MILRERIHYVVYEGGADGDDGRRRTGAADGVVVRVRRRFWGVGGGGGLRALTVRTADLEVWKICFRCWR